MNERVQKVAHHPATLPTGVGVLAFGLGIGLGFFLGRKTKKAPVVDIHDVPHVDLDLKVEEVETRKLDTYILSDETDGILVINSLNETIENYGSVSIEDLKDLLGIEPISGDDDWGWTNLDYNLVEKVKDGYMLLLPDPKRLDEDVDDEAVESVEKDEAVDKAVMVGRDFIKNRFLGLPDLPNDDDLVEIEDEAEDEASETEEVAPAEEVISEERSEEEASDPGVLTEVGGNRRANAFATGGDTWDLLKEMEGRTESAPYVLHKDEFYADEKGYAQHSLTYYAGDDMMADEDDKPLYPYDRVVGPLKWGHGSGDPEVFYVRNDKYRAEYEITHVDGLFSVEVMGDEIEDTRRTRSLEHSGEPRRFRDRTE